MSTVEHTEAPGSLSGEAAGPAPTRRAVATGAALTAVMVVTVMVVGGEIIPGLVVVFALFAGLAVGLLRSRARWLLVLAVVLPVLALVTSIPFIVSDLSHPESAGGFVPQLLLSLAASFTALAAGAALGGRGRLVRPAAVVFATCGLLGSSASAVATAGLTDDVAMEGDVVVVAEGVEFPARVTLRSGPVGLLLDNGDPIRHTFVIDGTDVDQEMPGSTARRLVVDLEPGTYRYFCDVPGHDGMEGSLVVD